jgi:hypothetical protein
MKPAGKPQGRKPALGMRRKGMGDARTLHMTMAAETPIFAVEVRLDARSGRLPK